jgi:hypothetical protein
MLVEAQRGQVLQYTAVSSVPAWEIQEHGANVRAQECLW